MLVKFKIFQFLAGKKLLHSFQHIYLVYRTDVLSDQPNVVGRETRFVINGIPNF